MSERICNMTSNGIRHPRRWVWRRWLPQRLSVHKCERHHPHSREPHRCGCGERWAAAGQGAYRAAVAGSATPTEVGGPNERGGHGFLTDPDVAGSATPTGDDDE